LLRPNLILIRLRAKRGYYVTVLYVIKWVPRDQDVIIDHTKRYEDPAEALTVAREPAA